MKKTFAILGSLLISLTAGASTGISPECASRIKSYKTRIQTAAMATRYYQGLCKIDGIQPSECPTTDKDVANADAIALAVRTISYSNKPLTEPQSTILTQIVPSHTPGLANPTYTDRLRF